MAYTKKTWVSGETPCSSENFNHMEQGIADAHNKLDELNTKIYSINPTKNFLRSSNQKTSGTIEISMSADTGYIDFYLSSTKIIRVSANESSLDYWIIENGQIVKGTNVANFN